MSPQMLRKDTANDHSLNYCPLPFPLTNPNHEGTTEGSDIRGVTVVEWKEGLKERVIREIIWIGKKPHTSIKE